MTAQLLNGISDNEIKGDGYIFYRDSGTLEVSSYFGTTKWRDDKNIDKTEVLKLNLLPSVSSIGFSAFQDCTELELDEIPSTITTMYGNAFKGCTNLTWLMMPKNPPSMEGTGQFDDILGLYLLLPYERSGKYDYSPWNNYKIVDGGSGLTDLTISNGELTTSDGKDVKPFSPTDKFLYIKVPYDVGEITFTPTSYLDAGITINNKAVNSGSESPPIGLRSGGNTTVIDMKIDVVNGDLNKKKTIKIFVDREERKVIPINTGCDIPLPQPVTGAEASRGVLVDTDQYSIQMYSWFPSPGRGYTFEPNREYTATISLIPKDGYTLDGMQKGLFTVNGEAKEFQEQSSSATITIMKISFPKTVKAPVDTSSIWLTAPVTGAVAEKKIKDTQFTATVEWKPALNADDTFAAGTVYTATITLTPAEDYTLDGVEKDFFKVTNARTTANEANSGVVTAVFHKTIEPVNLKQIKGVTKPVTGGYPWTDIEDTNQYIGSVEWEPEIPSGKMFQADTEYTATITLIIQSGYTKKGIPKDFFEVEGAVSVTNDEDSDIVKATFARTDATVDKKIITGVTAPVAGEKPVTAITDTEQYTGKVTWRPGIAQDGTFAANTNYTAEITLEPKKGYTMSGVPADFFEVEGAERAENKIDSGIIEASFARTAVTANRKNITGVTAPVTGEKPVTAITETEQYTGSVVWSPAIAEGESFADDTKYTAVITLIPKKGYTVSGVPKDYFEVEGAESTENRINSGIITARFAKTDAAVNSKNIKGVTAPATGEKPVTSITETEQYTGSVVWSPAIASGGSFAANTEYTATITLALKKGYTLTGVTKDYFEVEGAARTANAENSGIITAHFAGTDAIRVSEVTLDRTSLFMKVGETEKLSVIIDPLDATNPSVIWTTGDAGIAAVDSDGTVHAVGTGRTALTVTALDGGKTAVCTVFVRTSVEESGDDGQEADNIYPILNGQIPASEGHGLWKEQGSGAWKFLKDKEGYAQKEWLKIGEDWYLFGDNSIMITGWSLVNQTWYYSGGSGAMLTGWQFINGSWYYLRPDGSMAVGWLEADGKWYYLRPDGSCLINGVTPDGYRVDGNGVWDGNEK